MLNSESSEARQVLVPMRITDGRRGYMPKSCLWEGGLAGPDPLIFQEKPEIQGILEVVIIF